MTTSPHPADSIPQDPGHRTHRRDRCSSVGGWYIAAIVAGFIVFWPIGLALLVWAIWRDQIKEWPIYQKLRGTRMPQAPSFTGFARPRPSNSALAEYLEREQQRLKAEQQKLDELVKAFEAFKDAEHKARDQRDFEEFLQSRNRDTGADAGAESRS